MRKFAVLFVFVLLMAFSISAEMKNPDKPEKGGWDFQLQKVWQVDNAGGKVLGKPRQVAVSDNGTVYVFDLKNRSFFLFDSAGKFIKAFGKRGEGPGEIRNMNRLYFFLVKDKLIAVDATGFHYYAGDGKYLKSEVNNNLSRRPVCFIDDDRFISAPLTIPDPRQQKGKIRLVNLKTKKETLITEFSVFEGGSDTREGPQGGVRTVIVIGVTPMMILNYHNKKIYYGMNDSFRVHSVDLEGKKIDSFSVKRSKRKIDGQVLKDRFNSLPRKPPPDVVNAIVKSLPDVYAYFHRLEFHNDLIYLFLPDLKDMTHQRIDIFSPQGKYLYKADLKLPEGYSFTASPFNTSVIKNGHYYTVLEDDEGEIVLAKFKITIPK